MCWHQDFWQLWFLFIPWGLCLLSWRSWEALTAEGWGYFLQIQIMWLPHAECSISEGLGENRLLPFLFVTENRMWCPALAKSAAGKVRVYWSPNWLPLDAALLTCPPPKWSQAQPVNHFSAPSFALRLIIILRNNGYVNTNWDICVFYIHTHTSTICYLLKIKSNGNCLLIWWIPPPPHPWCAAVWSQ